MAQGPLNGVRVVEFAGIGPGPFCAMLLSDLGAEVVRIDRPNAGVGAGDAALLRGRRMVALDLKAPADAATALELMAAAEIVLEGFRPGVMERLGLGPEAALARRPSLVYGRMTGWGQTGPLSQRAGHDIDYLALTGALHAIGTAEKPVAPLNLAADFGGGALYLVMGVLAALTHARATGEGQVVDAAMTDGAASLMAMFYGMRSNGLWEDRRAANLLDGGAPFYDTYRCADGEWVAVGSIEPAFYRQMLTLIGAPDLDEAMSRHFDKSDWPARKVQIAELIAGRPRDDWAALAAETDACIAPVLSLEEAPSHAHNVARRTFVEVGGVVQPGPAPRFSATPGAVQGPPRPSGTDTDAVLAEWGIRPYPLAREVAAERTEGVSPTLA